MNIVIATSKRKVNGAVVHARRILSRLAARGHRVWLAAAADSWIAAQTAGEAALLPTDFRRWPLGEVGRVAEFCRRERIDLFHSHSTRSSHFGAMLQALHGVPSVAQLHCDTFQAHVYFHSLLIAVSHHTLARHRGWLAGLGERGVVLPNFIEAGVWRAAAGGDRLRELLGVPSGTPVLFVAGQICRTKGQDLAVRALAIVRRTHPSAVLAVAGRGRPRKHHQGEGVRLIGYREDLPELLPHATIVVVPSRREAFGLVAAEAMACGVPVVAADAGGVAEVVAGGGGIVVPRNDAAAVAEAVVGLLSDASARARMGEAGRRIVEERYAPGPHIEALERHYESVVATRSGLRDLGGGP